jgi:hypothetical protein
MMTPILFTISLSARTTTLIKILRHFDRTLRFAAFSLDGIVLPTFIHFSWSLVAAKVDFAVKVAH